MDARSGETLYEKNADTRLHPASLTKMMTLYIVFQEIEAGRLSLDSRVTVSKHAAAQPPSRLGLKPGQKIALRYLIRAAAVKSANDAATAIGEHVSGSEAAFAKRMTRTARALGMKNSTFRNANGLTTEGHLSTARDMNILGRHLFYDFPQYYNIFSRRTADAGVSTVRNTNSRFLDSYEGADGIKTGYTVAAGFNLTASAKRGNKRIIATVFGGTSTAARNVKMAELMDMGFGIARNNVREKKPEAAPLPDDALIAAAPPEIDVPDAEGGAAKTIRVSGEVKHSLRPRARPTHAVDPEGVEAAVAVAAAEEPAPEVPDALSMAIAEGVESALAEATAAPEGTLDAQAQDLAEAAEAAPTGETAVVATAEASEPALPAEGSFDAQAEALAQGAAPAEAPPLAAAPVEGQDLPTTGVAAAEAPSDPALAALRPQPRPDRAAVKDDPASLPQPELAAVTPDADEASAAAPEPAPVATAGVAGIELAELPEIAPPAAPEPAPAAAFDSVTRIETVVAETAAPARKAPIFDPVEMAEAAPEEAAPEQDLVVIAKSTSGGSHWGVAVGAYASRAEAERALLKTGLAESTTLNGGLKKITQKGGAWRASFLGLSEDQADLACRRLRARGMACETVGPG